MHRARLLNNKLLECETGNKKREEKHKKRVRNLRFEVVTVLSVKNVVFCDMEPCNLVAKKLDALIFVFYPEEGGSGILRNTGTYLQNYIASQRR
jgi:hypothetical protein